MGFAHEGNPGPKITHTKFKKYCTERKVWRRANFSLEVSGHTKGVDRDACQAHERLPAIAAAYPAFPRRRRPPPRRQWCRAPRRRAGDGARRRGRAARRLTSGALSGPAGGTAPAAAVAARGRKSKGASSPAAAGSAAAATAPSGTDIAQATATASGRRGKRATPGGTSTPEADKRPAKRQQQATAVPLVRLRGEQRGAAAPRPRPRFPTVRLRERLRRRRCRRLCCCRGGRGAARSSQAEYEEEGSAAWKTKGASARPATSRLPRPKRAAGKAAYQLQRERWRRQRPRRPPPQSAASGGAVGRPPRCGRPSGARESAARDAARDTNREEEHCVRDRGTGMSDVRTRAALGR